MLRFPTMDMSRSKVTRKFQLTIPKDIREKVGLRAGEVVMVENLGKEEIRIRRFPRVEDPLGVLIGVEPFSRHVPVEELEDRIEER